MNIKRTWLKFRLAAISIAIDDCMRREAQAQAATSKLIQRETRLRQDLAGQPAPSHTRHIITMPNGG